MRVCVIGGTGHIGKFLIPLLAEPGNEVFVTTSGARPPPAGDVWRQVELVRLQVGSPGWTDSIARLKPEVIIDILQSDSPALYAATVSSLQHMIVCGSVWMFGEPAVVPAPPKYFSLSPFDGYNRRYEQLMKTMQQAGTDGVAFTAIMPPNICGPYKIPLDCRGGRSLAVHISHSRGEPVILPEPGNNLIGPCDAEDIAACFFAAFRKPLPAAGQIFNVGSAYALTLVQFVNTYAAIYKVKIPIEFVDWSKFERDILPDIGAHWHFKAPMCPDISKTSELLGYHPRYTPEESMERAVRWMVDGKMLRGAG